MPELTRCFVALTTDLKRRLTRVSFSAAAGVVAKTSLSGNPVASLNFS